MTGDLFDLTKQSAAAAKRIRALALKYGDRAVLPDDLIEYRDNPLALRLHNVKALLGGLVYEIERLEHFLAEKQP